MKKYKIVTKQGKICKSKICKCNSYSELFDKLSVLLCMRGFNYKEIHVDFNRNIPIVKIVLWE